MAHLVCYSMGLDEVADHSLENPCRFLSQMKKNESYYQKKKESKRLKRKGNCPCLSNESP